jgi:hypothetical protein
LRCAVRFSPINHRGGLRRYEKLNSLQAVSHGKTISGISYDRNLEAQRLIEMVIPPVGDQTGWSGSVLYVTAEISTWRSYGIVNHSQTS